MANRIITIYCADETIQKSSSVAGAAGSSNAVTLRLSFSAAWDGTTKKVYFYDATKAKSACIICTTDKLVTGETDVYDIPIPAEALDVAGKMLLTVKGVVVSGTTVERCMMSATTTMDVLPADMPSTDSAPVEPTPMQSEQLQSEIDGIKSSISGASTKAAEAAKSADSASQSASAASISANAALQSSNDAASSQSSAAASKIAAEASATAAKTSETNAAASASASKASETNAKSSETAAAGSATTAAGKAETAASSASAAAASETAAKGSETAASGSASAAKTSELAAAADKTAAESARAAADGRAGDAEAWAVGQRSGTDVSATDPTYHNNSKYYKEQAAAIVGGDYATKTEAQGYVDTHNQASGVHAALFKAQSDAIATAKSEAVTTAESYTDQKVATIDMSAKADKKSPTAAGNLAALDSNGNLADSGKTLAEVQALINAKQDALTYIYKCTGTNDNIAICDIVNAFMGASGNYAGTAATSLKLVVVGNVGISSMSQYTYSGSDTCAFLFSNSNSSRNTDVIVDFNNAEFSNLAFSGSRNAVFANTFSNGTITFDGVHVITQSTGLYENGYIMYLAAGSKAVVENANLFSSGNNFGASAVYANTNSQIVIKSSAIKSEQCLAVNIKATDSGFSQIHDCVITSAYCGVLAGNSIISNCVVNVCDDNIGENIFYGIMASSNSLVENCNITVSINKSREGLDSYGLRLSSGCSAISSRIAIVSSLTSDTSVPNIYGVIATSKDVLINCVITAGITNNYGLCYGVFVNASTSASLIMQGCKVIAATSKTITSAFCAGDSTAVPAVNITGNSFCSSTILIGGSSVTYLAPSATQYMPQYSNFFGVTT